MVAKRGLGMDFGTEMHEIPEILPTAVISAKQWADITGVVAQRLGKQEDKREAKRYVAVLKECGYDTIETLRTAVARELRQELGIPPRATVLGDLDMKQYLKEVAAEVAILDKAAATAVRGLPFPRQWCAERPWRVCHLIYIQAREA